MRINPAFNPGDGADLRQKVGTRMNMINRARRYQIRLRTVIDRFCIRRRMKMSDDMRGRHHLAAQQCNNNQQMYKAGVNHHESIGHCV